MSSSSYQASGLYLTHAHSHAMKTRYLASSKGRSFVNMQHAKKKPLNDNLFVFLTRNQRHEQIINSMRTMSLLAKEIKINWCRDEVFPDFRLTMIFPVFPPNKKTNTTTNVPIAKNSNLSLKYENVRGLPHEINSWKNFNHMTRINLASRNAEMHFLEFELGQKLNGRRG